MISKRMKNISKEDVKKKLEPFSFIIVASIFQVITFVLFWVFVDFDSTFKSDGHSVSRYYKFYTDTTVIIFVGLGFLMTFLRKYGYSSIAMSFFLASLAIQWTILVQGFFENLHRNFDNHKIHLDIKTLIGGNFGAAAVLISFGALLGKVSSLQLVVVVFFEIVFYALNIYVVKLLLKVNDVGGSMVVHAFGSYFGITCSALSSFLIKGVRKSPHQVSRTTGDMLAVIGTIFLWVYWPSLNGALAPEYSQHRVILSTVCAMVGSCVGAFITSRLLRGGYFSMEDIHNATITGGVAVGSTADILVVPGGALTLGLLAGIMSVFGYRFLTPILNQIGIHDTCGVNNRHGLPGIIGGLGGIFASLAAQSFPTVYGDNYNQIFRQGNLQPLYQFLGLAVSLSIAFVGGAITGVAIRFLPRPGKFYDDSDGFETAQDFGKLSEDIEENSELPPVEPTISVELPKNGKQSPKLHEVEPPKAVEPEKTVISTKSESNEEPQKDDNIQKNEGDNAV